METKHYSFLHLHPHPFPHPTGCPLNPKRSIHTSKKKVFVLLDFFIVCVHCSHCYRLLSNLILSHLLDDRNYHRGGLFHCGIFYVHTYLLKVFIPRNREEISKDFVYEIWLCFLYFCVLVYCFKFYLFEYCF